MRRITYLYPIRKRVSFTIIARKHVKLLRERGLDVYEADIHNFRDDEIGKLTLVHPIFYPLIDSPRNYKKIIRNSEKQVGFDVCDTDRITPLASYVANLFDLVIVPSSFCKLVYKRSGVFTNIEVLPHGVDDVFLRPPRMPKDEDVKKIMEKKGWKILFFLWHSGFRKGADIVAEAFTRLVKEFNNVYLIVKLAGILDPFIEYMYHIPNVILFNKWLDEESLVDLYDACDIVVVPSRGGGFELNALEGLARGKIVIVSQWGSFDDYCRECLRCGSRKTVDLFLGDKIAKTIHNGKGVDPDPNDLYQKLKYALTMYDVVKKRYERLQKYVRKNYSWERIGDRLYSILIRYI